MEAAVRKFFVHLFENTARESGLEQDKVELCFMLKNMAEFKCMGPVKEIVLTEEDIRHAFADTLNFFITPRVVQKQLNKFIVAALLNFGKQNGIGPQSVNVVMKMGPMGFLIFILRSARSEVRELSLNEIINSS